MFFMFLCCFSLRREQKLRLAGREIELCAAFKSCCSWTEDGRVSQGRSHVETYWNPNNKQTTNDRFKLTGTFRILVKFHRHWQLWLWHVVQHGLRWWMIADMQCLGCSMMQRKTQTFRMRTQRLWTIRTESPVYKSTKSTTNSTEITATETDGQNIWNILIRVVSAFFQPRPGAFGCVEFEGLVSWRPSVRAVGLGGTRSVLLPRGIATRPQGEPGFY